MNQSILQYDTVALTPTEDAIRIIDQTELPAQLVFLDLYTQPEIWRAIQRLQVQGRIGHRSHRRLRSLPGLRANRDDRPGGIPGPGLHTAADYLASSRPTAGESALGAEPDGDRPSLPCPPFPLSAPPCSGRVMPSTTRTFGSVKKSANTVWSWSSPAGGFSPLQCRSAGHSKVRHRHRTHLSGAAAGIPLPGLRR